MEEKPLEGIYLELATLIRRATSRSLDKKLGTLERSAFLLLHQLAVDGPVGVKVLADKFRLDISTISRQTAAMEAKGYITRQRDPADGRASAFVITELGMHQLQLTRQIRAERFAALLQDWSYEECQQFMQLLAKLNQTYID